MKITIFTLTSELHDEKAVAAMTSEFLGSLGISYELKGNDYSDYGEHVLNLIYVRTGGTEGVFKKLLPSLLEKSDKPFYLLASGKSNSLAASMEILSFLKQQKLKGEIIHGSAEYIRQRIELLIRVEEARKKLRGCRLGVIGRPSDWLISSDADYDAVRKRLGVELVDIEMDELLAIVSSLSMQPSTEVAVRKDVSDALPGAERIYVALKKLAEHHRLQGFTLRCFDLLGAIKNTGCLALARLNAEGLVAGCEGDVPAMLSMMIVRSVLGVSGFQANPSSLNPDNGEIMFAHCTIPLDMVERYELDTHFESGIGVGIRGYMKEGDITLFKVSGDLSRHFIAEGKLVGNQSNPGLCRTQQLIWLDDKSKATYFLNNPIGNHHIVVGGRCGELLEELLCCI